MTSFPKQVATSASHHFIHRIDRIPFGRGVHGVCDIQITNTEPDTDTGRFSYFTDIAVLRIGFDVVMGIVRIS
jgi:hypothetical protein